VQYLDHAKINRRQVRAFIRQHLFELHPRGPLRNTLVSSCKLFSLLF